MGIWFKVKTTIDPMIFAAMSKRRGGSWRIIYSQGRREIGNYYLLNRYYGQAVI